MLPLALGALALAAQKSGHGLSGTWHVAECITGGKAAEEDQRKQMSVIFTDEKMTLSRPGKTREYSVSIDEAANPKAIDLTCLDGGLKGQVCRAIYELRGDELKLCLPNQGKSRPTEFKAPPDSNLILLVLNRSR